MDWNKQSKVMVTDPSFGWPNVYSHIWVKDAFLHFVANCEFSPLASKYAFQSMDHQRYIPTFDYQM